jgi:hypothetical protein
LGLFWGCCLLHKQERFLLHSATSHLRLSTCLHLPCVGSLRQTCHGSA